MPAAKDEVAEAEEEGISVNNSWGPKEILTENGKVKAIVFKKCLSVKDADGRFNPQYDENDLMTVECENVLLSIGQSIVWGDLLKGTKVEIRPNGGAIADPVTYQTAEPDIFVGGDVYTGPRFAIDAIAESSSSWIRTTSTWRHLTTQNARFRVQKPAWQRRHSATCAAHSPRSRSRQRQSAASAAELRLWMRISVSAVESVRRSVSLMRSI